LHDYRIRYDKKSDRMKNQILTGSVPDPDPPDPCFFGLSDPDPLVRGMDPDPALDPDPDPSINMQK
jgi:hypothetical protein